MGTNLYIGNLSFSTMENDLREKFEEVGKVESCNLIIDKHTGVSKGFAFVEMGSQDDANKAISTLDGAQLDGREIKVNEARPREEHHKSRSGGRSNYTRSRF